LLNSDNGTVADHEHVALIIVHNDDAGPPPTHDITAGAAICGDAPRSEVQWTAADGGGPIEGYTVTVTDTSDGSTITQQIPSWQTYASFYNVNPRPSPGPWTATVAVNSSNWPFPPVTVPMPVVVCLF